jgi:hypothetical protein
MLNAATLWSTTNFSGRPYSFTTSAEVFSRASRASRASTFGTSISHSNTTSSTQGKYSRSSRRTSLSHKGLYGSLRQSSNDRASRSTQTWSLLNCWKKSRWSQNNRSCFFSQVCFRARMRTVFRRDDGKRRVMHRRDSCLLFSENGISASS